MRSPALAIAWEFRQRHRWGLIAVAGYLLLLGTARLLILEPWRPDLDDPGSFAATTAVPMWSAFVYLVAVFSFGLAGDVAARQSMYPARLFTLPVTTAALAGWPMLYGTAAVVSLWVVARLLAPWPSGIDVPVMWPPLFVAAFLAWTQVVTWMPYGLPGLRVIAAVLLLATMDAVVFNAINYKVSEPLMVAVLAPQIPLAYLCARFAVARARRGDVPDWRGTFGRLGQIADVLPRRRRDHFPSPARAQLWFEWRRHGLALPVWVGILLPFELALLFVANRPALVFYTLLGVLLTPPFMAAFAAPTARASNPHVSDAYGLSPFLATRPLTSAALVAAKLRMAIWSTLAAWLLVLAAIPVALTWSGTWPTVIERARQAIEAVGTPRAIVLVLLGFSGLLVSTWKQLVQAFCIGLAGREWLVKSSAFLRLSLLIVVVPIIDWIETRNGLAVIWSGFPWILAGLVCGKMSAAAWIATRLYRSRLLDDRALVRGAALWLVVVLVLYGLLVWLFATPPFIPRYLPALVAILAVPLARPSAAQLALAWNRHR
jgi:hypothetical protein